MQERRREDQTHLVLGSFNGVRDVVDDHVDESSRRSKELRENETKEGSDVHLEHGGLEMDPECSQRRLERLRVLSKHLIVASLTSCEYATWRGPT
jgi:hypothetical protein